MKQILILLLMLAGLSSCLTVGRIERNCDKFAKVCTVAHEREIIYKDTTIYIVDTLQIKLPVKDTVFIHDTITVKNGLAFLPSKHYERGIIGLDVAVNYSNINAKAYLLDSTILFQRVDTVLIHDAITKETDKQVIQLPPVKYIPKFYRFTLLFFIVSVLALAGIIYLRYFKKGNDILKKNRG